MRPRTETTEKFSRALIYVRKFLFHEFFVCLLIKTHHKNNFREGGVCDIINWYSFSKDTEPYACSDGVSLRQTYERVGKIEIETVRVGWECWWSDTRRDMLVWMLLALKRLLWWKAECKDVGSWREDWISSGKWSLPETSTNLNTHLPMHYKLEWFDAWIVTNCHHLTL